MSFQMMPILPIMNTGIQNSQYTGAFTPSFMTPSIFNFNGSVGNMLPMIPVMGLGVATPFIYNNVNTGFSFGNLWNNFNTGVSNIWKNTKKALYSVPEISTKIQDEKFWRKLGYNAAKGQKLATYVKKAIEAAGLGKYIYGVDGKDMANAYGSNKNFKVISGKGIDTKKLPAGCIPVYTAGKSGYSNKYGHTEIALGNGTNVSDGKTKNPKPCSYILVPV